MAKLFMVCDKLGNALADGLRPEYAGAVATLIANATGQKVWLWDRSASATDLGREFKPVTEKKLGPTGHTIIDQFSSIM